jgi:hypothetical protein
VSNSETGGVRGQERDVATAGELDVRPGLCAQVGLSVAADLHCPEAGRELRREVDLQFLAAGSLSVDFGRQRARRVEDDQVALVEEASEL